jgi:hypothetical protein
MLIRNKQYHCFAAALQQLTDNAAAYLACRLAERVNQRYLSVAYGTNCTMSTRNFGREGNEHTAEQIPALHMRCTAAN